MGITENLEIILPENYDVTQEEKTNKRLLDLRKPKPWGMTMVPEFEIKLAFMLPDAFSKFYHLPFAKTRLAVSSVQIVCLPLCSL